MELYENIYTKGFSFGKNWSNFLEKITPEQVAQAADYLRSFFPDPDYILGKTVIDVWSGSGIMSLAFIHLGAKHVTSIDIDAHSVACTKKVQELYKISHDQWNVIQWSILDQAWIESLGTFDIVYSRWVIHHSGNMRQGLKNALSLGHDNSYLYIALYNTCTRVVEGTSWFWTKAKRIYSLQPWSRYILKPLYTLYLIAGITATGKNPISYIRGYKSFRGMNFFTDIEDRLGGYPYEHASYKEVIKFYADHGYSLIKWVEVRSIGCNEFLFAKKATHDTWN